MSFLDKVRFDRALKVHDGVFVHNYKELASELRLMTDHEFKLNLDDGKKIFSWITDNYGDEVILAKLKLTSSRDNYAQLIEKRIVQLEREEANKHVSKIPIYVDVIFFILFGLIILLFLRYVFLTDSDSATKKLDEYKASIEQLNEQQNEYADRVSRLEVENAELRKNLSIREEQILPMEVAIPAPRDRILLSDIKSNGSMIVILVNRSSLAEFTDTGSMLPVLDSKSTGIEIVPHEPRDIYPGDIISYDLSDGSTIIHRVLEIGYDDKGWYAYTKGDNNPLRDKDKIRFEQVKRVLVGILY